MEEAGERPAGYRDELGGADPRIGLDADEVAVPAVRKLRRLDDRPRAGVIVCPGVEIGDADGAELPDWA